MLRQKRERVEWLEFEILSEAKGLKHAIFLRHGGVSMPPYDSLNAGGGCGDTAQKIDENREVMRSILGCDYLVSGKQVHGTEVAMIPSCSLSDCDGLITAHPRYGLMIKHADCQAAIFYDPIREVVANVHAGWRGQVKNIYAETVQKMKGMGCRPQDILVGISPSLGPCCAEFIHYRQELPDSFWGFQSKPLHFDLWAISEDQLVREGILPQHIEAAKICTRCNPGDFFSYRREKTTGRNATIAVLNGRC